MRMMKSSLLEFTPDDASKVQGTVCAKPDEDELAGTFKVFDDGKTVPSVRLHCAT